MQPRSILSDDAWVIVQIHPVELEELIWGAGTQEPSRV